MKEVNLEAFSPKSHILVKGARAHNLKNISLVIPHKKLVVITGLSGSGKSSLAFDTLYAEGQRRYVESLPAYARQFMGKLDKPKVDYIRGITPAIAIEQKVNSTNSSSTVGTSTEVYDYLKIMYARVGRVYSESGQEVKKHIPTDVVDYVTSQSENEKLLLLSKISIPEGRTPYQMLEALSNQGFVRVKVKNDIVRIDEIPKSFKSKFLLVVDRVIVRDDEDFKNRLYDAVEIAFYEGRGTCVIEHLETQKQKIFSNKFELDGIEYLEPTPHLFSFNNSYGACRKCQGYGYVLGIDDNLVIPNTALSVYEGAIFPWRGENYKKYLTQLIDSAYKFDFPIHKPWFELSNQEVDLVWKGNEYFKGIDTFFNQIEKKNYKIQNRILLSRYRGRSLCKACQGTRLRLEANFVKIGGKSILELVNLPLNKLLNFFDTLELDQYQVKVSKVLLKEIKSRISFLINVGLEYLTLNRKSNSLSGGESQRINLATSLGSSLVGSLYILDEPSIGLHSRDSARLIKVLKALRDLGNTVIVVEHDEMIMTQADVIIDIGPEAGTKGGKLVAYGTFDEILTQKTLTAEYLNETLKIEVPQRRRPIKNCIKIIGAREHNLKNITVDIPLDMLTVVTGVSGSGKSTLVKDILYPAMKKHFEGFGNKIGQFSSLEGDVDHIQSIEYVNQNPIGRSSRSNPVTYIKAYDDIRNLFATQQLSKINGYQPKHFSFNISGGRCETCKGDGEVIIEMQFMADVHLKCEVCSGMRFKDDILDVKFQDKNISDVLNLTIDNAIDFFGTYGQKTICNKLKPLQDVGMGYVTLGQSSSTLSGGEAQRVKLASFLTKSNARERKLFIFDEPTTGLHFHDIKKLMKAFNALIEVGHSIIVVEHNIDFIKCADFIIDLGPEGGDKGGELIAVGIPEEISKNKKSLTGQFLKDKLVQ